jgi:hypothetical protein
MREEKRGKIRPAGTISREGMRGETKEIRVQYDTPYIRHLPAQLFLTETVGEALGERVI